jgi:hypothetical protein
LAIESLSAPPFARTLRLEAVEPRTMLSHTAPLLNPADTPHFTAIAENTAIGSNTGQTVISMLATGGPIVANQPLGTNFLSYDTNDGALEGIAVTGVGIEASGMWEYELQGAGSWTMLAPNVSTSNAVALQPNDLMRFLPNQGFRGTVSIQLVAWDHTDLLADGSRVDLTQPNATGGSTAYSSAGTSATVSVAASIAPTFTLGSTATAEDNTVAASGGSPGGSNPNVQTVPNFASNIGLGDGGNGTVTFNVADGDGTFGTFFSQAPAIDSQGTLTYKLNPDQYGRAYLNVIANNNGVTSSVQQTTITVTQINDPPTLNAITSPHWVQDTAGQQTINLTGISGGYNEPNDGVTVRAAATLQSGDNANLIYNLGVNYTPGSSTATVTYTPIPGQNGTLQATVTVTDSGSLTARQTFVVTVYSAPTYYLNTTGIQVVENAGAQTVPNLAISITSGYPNTSNDL